MSEPGKGAVKIENRVFDFAGRTIEGRYQRGAGSVHEGGDGWQVQRIVFLEGHVHHDNRLHRHGIVRDRPIRAHMETERTVYQAFAIK